MQQLTLKTSQSETSTIHVGRGLQYEVATFIKQASPSAVVYITEKYLQASLVGYLQLNPNDVLAIDGGESQKTLETVSKILQYLHEKSIDKHALIIGFGGGVVTDLVGFAAAIYKRGVKAVYIPTTLLAMIDASIGGKNGVDFEDVKNMAGTIYNPQAVFVDTDFLESLPEAELLSGLGELAKYAICLDRPLFDLLQEPFANHANEAILMGIKDKLKVLALDPYETTGQRYILNFGHTLGHALESASGYKLKHGLGVAIGCHFASFISQQKGYISQADFEAIVYFLKNLGLPTTSDFDAKTILRLMQSDKKQLDRATINFVLIRSIGQGIVEPLSFKEIEKHLLAFKNLASSH